MDDLEIVLNTHSSCNDALTVFVGQIEKHWPNHPPVVVGHNCRCLIGGLQNYRVVDYSPAASFSNQYLMTLAAVKAPYCLTTQDDFILYGDVDDAAIREAMQSVLSNRCIGFVVHDDPQPYSMQATIWNTQSLRQLYAALIADSPWEAEIIGISAAQGFNWERRVIDRAGKRRGSHCDSLIIPYVSTALVRGKWNMSEYPDILPSLLREYEIDPSVRGIR